MVSSTETTTAPARVTPGGIREVAVLAYPVVLTQISSTTMGVVDSAMVGRLGATELAAVGFGAVWMWTLFSLLFGTASGVQTFVSQSDGAGRAGECGRWAWYGLYAVLPASVLFVALLWPSVEGLVSLAGPSPELQATAATYIHGRLWGEIGFVVLMVFTSFFRGFGDTRTPLYVTLFANAVNAVLDYGLIFGELGLPEWGVRGAGIATAVGHWAGAAVLFAAFRRRRVAERFDTRMARPSAERIRRFLRTGLPIGGQWFMGMTTFAVFTTLVARMGDASMAASQAFVMLLSLSFMQAVGISIAASTLVGRYVGAGSPAAARQSYRSAIALGLGLGGLVAAVFLVFPEALLRIFTDDPDVVRLGRPLLLVGAIFQLIDAMAIITEGSLRGAGDTRWPFLIEVALGWGVFVPAVYVVSAVFGSGLTGVWVAFLLHLSLLATLFVRRFRSGAWERIRI